MLRYLYEIRLIIVFIVLKNDFACLTMHLMKEKKLHLPYKNISSVEINL